MNNICRNIFRAIHEGKWLKIEYKNQADQVTKYWIGIRDLRPFHRTLKVDGLHLGKYTLDSFDKIFIDSILDAEIIEGSYCERNEELIHDIAYHPEKYLTIFEQSANLKILNYLELCNKLDTTPYMTDYALVQYLDRDSFNGDVYPLSEEQFHQIVQNFQYDADTKKTQNGPMKIKQLAMNVLSIHTEKGLYVLAYRKLNLDAH